MKILDKKNVSNYNIDNGLSNIMCECGCVFSATEDDIEVQVITVPYRTGIRGYLKMPQTYIRNRYITCPNCFKKMKVTFCVKDSILNMAKTKEE